MRELKFRDYTPEENKLRYFDIDGYDIEEHGKWGEVMQYTGLKDKNGKEIYEGDIVEYPYENDDENIVYKKYKLYQDQYGAYKLEGWNNNMTWEDYSDQPVLHVGRIIGNIYENPDLIDNL